MKRSTYESIDVKLTVLTLLMILVLVYKFYGGALDNKRVNVSSESSIDVTSKRSGSRDNDSDRIKYNQSVLLTNNGASVSSNPFVANREADRGTYKNETTPLVGGEYLPTGEVEEVPEPFDQWLKTTFTDVDSGSHSPTASNRNVGDIWLGEKSPTTIVSGSQSTEDSSNQTLAAALELQSLEIEQTDLTIAGQVVTTSGRPVNGLKITAASKAGAAESISGRDGRFTLRGLKLGDYDVRVDGGDNYSGAKKQLRAGERGVRLVVASPEQKKISGIVSDAYGVPVAGATVRVPEVEPVTTGVDGSFEFEVQRNNKSGKLVRYKAVGFLDTSLHIVGDNWQQSEVDASIQLHEAGVIIFSGNVINDNNIPVPNAYVELNSRSPAFRLSAKTDEQGNFLIPNVRPSQSVAFTVKAGNHYKSYRQSGLTMIEDTNVSVSLQSEVLTRLTATFIGSNGGLLSNMGFLATNSTHKNATVFGTSNTDGVLVIEDISPGSFLLRSAVNSPLIIVNGINVGADSNAVHQIKVDVGPFVLRGLLTDIDGRPVVNANLNMIHVNENEGVTAKTSRTAVSRSDGTFEFGGLGAGTREIVVASESGSNTTFYADPAESTSGVVVLR